MLALALLLLAQPVDDTPLVTGQRQPRVFQRQFPVPAAKVEAAPAMTAGAATAALPLLREAASAPEGPLERKTKVEAGALQVVFGERAVFQVAGEDGAPSLVGVEPGRLAVAHPLGSVRETFAQPAAGRLAAALDGSAEMGASFLKVWNSSDKPVSYRAQALVLRGGKITRLAAPVCAVPPGQARTQSWPSAIAGVVLSRFTTPEPDAITHAGCG